MTGLKNKTKKLNTYLKYGLILAVCVLFGGVCGYLAVSMEGGLLSLGDVVQTFFHTIRAYMLPILAIMFVVEIVLGELFLFKMKKLGVLLNLAEDDEGDRIDYEMERVVAWGTGCMIVLFVLAIVVLATGYSIEYIEKMALQENGTSFILIGFLIFIMHCVYNGYWSIRVVKYQQKIEPRLKGDPTSTRFSEQWFESCDEAEKERIYQAAFKSYTTTGNWLGFLILIAMLTHLIWNTGIAAIIYIGIIWLVLNITYLRTCLKKMKEKIIR